PRQELGQACDQGDELGRVGVVFAFVVEGDQRDALFGVVPASPAEHRGGVVGSGGVGVEDEAFFGHVEFAAGLPIGGPAEVGRGVLGRYGDLVGGEFSPVFGALSVPGGLPFGELSQSRVLEAMSCQVRNGLIFEEV